MPPLPLALSIHHFISSVGADAGFAAIIGLAILVLLYFAQARETASLRNRTEEAAERVRELESRLVQIARRRAAPANQPAAAAPAISVSRHAGTGGVAPAPAPPGVAAWSAPPGAPAGVGAPALAAATKLIPTPVILERQPPPDTPDTYPDPLADDSALAAAGPPPAIATNGAGREHLAPSPAGLQTSPPGAGGAWPGAAGTQRDEPAPRSAARPYASLPRMRERRRRPPVLRFLALLLGALVVAGVVVVLLKATSGSGKQTAANTSAATNAPGRHHARRTPPVKPSSVTVAVLNGTNVTGLAARTSARLASAGYRKGLVGNALNQNASTTSVSYMLPADKPDAVAVASALKLGSASVQPIGSTTRKVACPPPSACTTTVVVTLGANLANEAQ